MSDKPNIERAFHLKITWGVVVQAMRIEAKAKREEVTDGKLMKWAQKSTCLSPLSLEQAQFILANLDKIANPCSDPKCCGEVEE